MPYYLVFISSMVLSLLSVEAFSQAPSPYSGQEQREIKALSRSQVEGLLAGRGMGYARAAELNGYPGPLHVLELADDLELDAKQRKATQQIFDEMLRDAKALGAELVAAERRLDQAFRNRDIDEARVSELTEKIALIEARLRAVHLSAHLHQTKIMTQEQIANYMSLRGYSKGHHGAHQHHH